MRTCIKLSFKQITAFGLVLLATVLNGTPARAGDFPGNVVITTVATVPNPVMVNEDTFALLSASFDGDVNVHNEFNVIDGPYFDWAIDSVQYRENEADPWGTPSGGYTCSIQTVSGLQTSLPILYSKFPIGGTYKIRLKCIATYYTAQGVKTSDPSYVEVV